MKSITFWNRVQIE